MKKGWFLTMSRELGKHLIFLIGLPRSGTTLLQALLRQHSKIFTYSEAGILLHPLFALKEGGLIAPAYSGRDVLGQLQDLLEVCENGVETYLEAVRALANTLYSSCLKKSGKELFVDKTPMYYLIVREIYKIFPEAKFILLMRNPLSILSSIARAWFHGKCNQILNHPVYMQTIMLGPLAMVDALSVLKDRSVSLRYEDLVTNPKQELERICAYLGIEFDDKMLSYDKSGVGGSHGDPVRVHEHSRPVSDFVDKWKDTFKEYANWRFGLSYTDYLDIDVFNTLGYSYEEVRNELLNLKKQPAYVGFFYFWNAFASSLVRSLRGAMVASIIEFKRTWRTFYPKLPPSMPNFRRVEGKWGISICGMLKPTEVTTLKCYQGHDSETRVSIKSGDSR